MKNTGKVPPPSELRRRVAEGRYYRRVEPSGVVPRDEARSGHALPAGIAERFVRRMNEVWDNTWQETLDDVCEWEQGAKAAEPVPNTRYRRVEPSGVAPRSDVLVAGTMEPALLGRWQEWCRANSFNAPMVAIGAPARADHIAIGAVACDKQPSAVIPQEIPPGWKWFEGFSGVEFFCSGSTKSVHRHPTTPGVWCAQREGGALEFTALIDALMWCYGLERRDGVGVWRWCSWAVAKRYNPCLWLVCDSSSNPESVNTDHTHWWKAVAAAYGKTPAELGMV